MYKLLKQDRPNVIQSYTPKAGLITMVAARLAQVPVRIHGVVGMPLMETRGLKRQLMKLTERFTYFNATEVTSNSLGLRDFINSNLSHKIVTVIGEGSINGVDLNHFSNDHSDTNIRKTLDISPEATVYIFVGRLVPDKGVSELINAFLALAKIYDDVHLWLVGEEEAALSPLTPDIRMKLNISNRIHKLGWQKDVKPFLAEADVFVLPSYREGLPNSLLEAGAMSLPSIVTNINGCNEVIQQGVNGLLVPAKNEDKLQDAMATLCSHSSERESMGIKARELVQLKFDQRVFLENLISFYQNATV
jgi:glycosyltransferase involved in cell wall biosynthesis